jgi:hypothetical protein
LPDRHRNIERIVKPDERLHDVAAIGDTIDIRFVGEKFATRVIIEWPGF